MCGIAGALALESSPFRVTEAYLARLCNALVHRGPDGEGTWISKDGRVGLGHRRLSIIDLSAAAGQPMCNEDRTLWITFNGEIYNHGQIRAELESVGGHHWRTDHSDTEVILHAFEQWGIGCVHRFRGMFAMALWDGRKRELWLVRDRIGIKPLYYSVHNGRLTFASEIKALLQDPDQARTVDEEAFYHYLSFLTTPAPSTLFQGIRKLPGGMWLRAREDGQMELRRYWDAWENCQPLEGASEHEIAARLLQELRTAVQLRKVSDVPVGVFLSGGIDSSTNAALFSEGEEAPIQTFSIGYDRDYLSYSNELGYARQMAQRVGAQHHERILTQDDLLDFLPAMVHLQDEPLADPVCIPVYYLSKLARDHGVIVCQVGEGSDELFCGYTSWQQKLRLQRHADGPFPTAMKQFALKSLRLFGADGNWPYEFVRRAARGIPIFWGGAEALTEGAKQHLLSSRLRRQMAGLTSWEALQPIWDRFEEGAWEKSALHWMTYLDLNLRLPELLLMRVDKMSMGVSLECRVPFLDHKFVELALSIPTALKLRRNTPKYILKRSVRGLIPDELIDRKKQGFGVPVAEWLLDKLGHFAEQKLNEFCVKTDYLDRNRVRQLFKEGQSSRIWLLLNFALWFDHYIAGAEQEQSIEACAASE